MPPSFKVIVGKTYHATGYFYVPQAHAHRFRRGSEVKINLPGREPPVYASVKGVPRQDQTWIDGGRGLRNWFQKNLRVGDLIRAQVQGSNCIDIASL